MTESLASECLQHSDAIKTTVIDRVLLRQLSPKDAKWDDRRAETDRVKELYSGTYYDGLAGRISECSGWLKFGFDVGDDGTSKLRLNNARFCRVRHCPVCQWRRSLMWRARAFNVLPKVMEDHPKYRFIFLTLTVRNCELLSLKSTIGEMNKAFSRLTKRAQWPAVGWIKSLEVTRGVDDTAHPHFHCLLMVKPGYFSGKNYVNQEQWTTLWQETLRINYKPMVHVQAVKPKKNSDMIPLDAILETMKYTVKPDDLIGKDKEPTDKDKEWLVNLTKQLHKTRAVATGGILKEYLKQLEEEPEDLIHVDGEDDEDEQGSLGEVIFHWNDKPKKYIMRED